MTQGTSHEGGVVRVLPVWGRFSKAGGIEISSTPQGFRQLATVLVNDESTGEWRLRLPRAADPKPYDQFLTTIRVERQDGPVRVALQGATLVFGGSPEKLRILAENVGWLADKSVESPRDGAGEHIHIEYHSEHFYLAPDSEPLVLEIAREDDPAPEHSDPRR